MIKIAFFDIDGTLLKMGNKEPTDKTVSSFFVDCILSYRKHIIQLHGFDILF